jgi:hypothetical protein
MFSFLSQNGSAAEPNFGIVPKIARTKLLIEIGESKLRANLAQRAGMETVFVALLTIVVVVLLAFSAAFAFRYPPFSARTSTTMSTCSLVTPSEEQSVAGIGAYQNVPGLNQSSPPWNYPSIYQNIQDGWESLCQSQVFINTIQAHDVNGVAIGGGFINTASPDASVAGISISWWRQTLSNCTSYQESWSIFIVNGTVSAPLTTAGACISSPPS